MKNRLVLLVTSMLLSQVSYALSVSEFALDPPAPLEGQPVTVNLSVCSEWTPTFRDVWIQRSGNEFRVQVDRDSTAIYYASCDQTEVPLGDLSQGTYTVHVIDHLDANVFSEDFVVTAPAAVPGLGLFGLVVLAVSIFVASRSARPVGIR